MDERLLKPYNPTETERRIYEMWEHGGYFKPETSNPNATEKFSMVMPPPNVTGVLHMGHALMLSLEDVMTRFARMRGKKTLWLPGTDHAAIATQAVVEKEVYKTEGKNRHEIGREALVKRIEQFAAKSHDTIVSQVRTMGASCDWSREAFTLDEPRSLAVRTMFKKMYDDGLIYRGNRVVNWDPKGQTTISDDEIVYEEREATLYTFKYRKDFPIAIATTRPETKVGDTAVAVHPDDPRYQAYVGQEFKLEFCGVPLTIKIIADASVDPAFGTGALGVTPAHSLVDYELAQRHQLPLVPVINEYAKLTVGDDRLQGKKTTEARAVIVEWLRSEGLLEKEEKIKQNVGLAERTGGLIEPLPKLQWFVDVNKEIPSRGKSLKVIMREPVASGKIKIIPEHFEKIYFHWIENLRDWCISRQIWYGHRIPVYYPVKSAGADHGASLHVGEPPESGEWEQDPDTLDTWFSSGLWTFSTLGWPAETADLKAFHPTDMLETGYEIIFFWVARMIMLTGYALDEIPFKTVYLHGTVRDAQGRKMSKSLGNGIDPIMIAEKFGADAARMALLVGNTPGTDSRISEDKIRGYKHFANKIWNASRFVLENKVDSPAPTDHPYLTDLQNLTTEITTDLDNFRYHLAGEKLYHYFWHVFADKIIEEAKKDTALKSLLPLILERCLILLHPFMPFVTEELWSIWKPTEPPLIITQWPS
jgi:valyl-tRNA synthetase